VSVSDMQQESLSPFTYAKLGRLIAAHLFSAPVTEILLFFR